MPALIGRHEDFLIVLRVKPTDPPAFKRNMDPAACRNRFRMALLGAA